MTQANKPAATPKRITIEIPKDLDAVYSNVAMLTHTAAEMIMDFAQVLPRMPKGKVLTRVIMSPMHAKQLQLALNQGIANYERQFGEIKVPQQPSIADQFFNISPNDEDDKDDKENEE